MKGKKPAGVIGTVSPAVPHRAEGGGIAEAGGNPHVFQAVKKRKFGGRAGGKSLGSIGGAPSRPRLDRPGRKLGGRALSNAAPLSTAAKSA